MGAGASVSNSDWDSLDVPVSDLTTEVKSLNKLIEEQKQTIAEDDFSCLRRDTRKMFKPHSSIIKRLTARTKSQMARIGQMNEGNGLKKVFALSDKYGNFLKCCMKTPAQTNVIIIKTSCSGLGCDVETLVNLICSSTAAELESIDAGLQNVIGFGELSKVVVKNCSQEKMLRKFFEFAFAGGFERKDCEEYLTNNNYAKDEAATLNGYLTATNPEDVDKIFGMLAKATRSHTGQIAEAYKEAYGVDLEKHIYDRFFANQMVSAALISWVASIPRAIARMLFAFSKKIKPNSSAFELIYGVLSRHEKPMLAEIAKELTAVGAVNNVEITMDSLIGSCMSGKLAQAVRWWCSTDGSVSTPDKSTEYELSQYMATNTFSSGEVREVSLEQVGNLIKNATTAAVIKDILERQSNELEIYKRSSIVQDEEAEAEWGEEEDIMEIADNQDSIVLISCYLRVLFTYFDKDCSGLLDADEFWGMVDALALGEFGFSEDEIASMRNMNDWDTEGNGIAYEEVITELASSMFKAAVKQGTNVDALTKNRIAAHGAMINGGDAGTSSADKGASNEPVAEKTEPTEAASEEPVDPNAIRTNKLYAAPVTLPPHIESWIHDTFNTYDVDHSGELDIDECMKCISAMNLGTTEYDMEKLRQAMDKDGDKKITWSEAIEPLTDMILSMSSDQRDHWIGLVDKESGYLFWFNLKDGNSMWMSYEDQEAYKAQQISAPTAVVSDQKTVAMDSLTSKSMYEDIHQDKLAKLRESEAKAQTILQESLGNKQDNQKRALQERLKKKRAAKS